MSEQQPIPRVFQEAIGQSVTFKDFLDWSDDVVKRATTDPLFDPQELKNAKFTDQESDTMFESILSNVVLLARLEKVTGEALEIETLPLVVDYAQTFISSQGERFPSSLVPILASDPEKLLEIMRMGHEFILISVEAVKTGFDLARAIEFVTSGDQETELK